MAPVFEEKIKPIINSLRKLAEYSNPRKYRNCELDIEVEIIRNLIDDYIDTAYTVQSWNDGGV